ncbi:MAG: BamA/TamA family outer membrane protein [Bryobacteraceae bacterium]
MRTVLFVFIVIPTMQAQDCPAGRYCAILGVKDGRIVRIAGAPHKLDEAFDRQLAKLEKPYRLTLTPEHREAEAKGTFSGGTGLLDKARDFPTGTNEDYAAALQDWCDAYADCESQAGNILSVQQLFKVFGGYQDDGLLFDVVNDFLEFESGRVVFRVAPPFSSASVKIQIPASASPVKRIAKLKDWLKPLDGEMWNRPAVATRLLAYYSALGLDPTIDSNIEENSITILEGTRIQGIAFPFGLPVKDEKTDWNKVDQALYAALSDGDFRGGYLARRDAVRGTLESKDTPDILFARDFAKPMNEAPFLSRLRLPIQQLLLQQGGFSLAVSTPTLQLIDGVVHSLAFYRLEDISAAPPVADAVTAAPATADANGHVTPNAASVVPALAPQVKTSLEDCVDDPGQKPKTRFAGFGFSYKPGQGVRVFGLGQQNFANSGLSVRAGQGGPGTPLATANFSTDYFAFSRLHRRVSFSFQGGTDAEANRFLGNGKVNERRTGARARAEIELFRDRRGHLLKLFTEAARLKISLAAISHTNTLDFGAVHSYESSGTPYPWTWRLEPIVRWGLQTGSVQSHQRASATVRFHKSLPMNLAADIGAQAAFASAGTPLFDQPSLGGADSLRGFRRDDAIALRLWTLQPELWTPIRPNIKLAFFHDLGNAGDLTATPRRGPGLGVRFLAGPAVLRADWAYGLGPAATGGSRGKFYFSVTTNLPF